MPKLTRVQTINETGESARIVRSGMSSSDQSAMVAIHGPIMRAESMAPHPAQGKALANFISCQCRGVLQFGQGKAMGIK